MTGLLARPLRPGRLDDQTCPHQPRSPDALAADRAGARAVASHPEQGWSLHCSGVVSFDDGGALLPGGTAVPPALTCTRVVVPAAMRRRLACGPFTTGAQPASSQPRRCGRNCADTAAVMVCARARRLTGPRRCADLTGSRDDTARPSPQAGRSS